MEKTKKYETLCEKEEELEKAFKEMLEKAEKTDKREDEIYGKDKRGDELLEGFREKEERLKRIREAKRRLEEEQKEKREYYEEKMKERKEKGIYPTFEEKKEEPDNLAFKMVRDHHLVPDMLNYFDNLKGVGIIRHPCAVINSWLSTPKEFPDDVDPKEEWRHGECRNKGHPEEYWGFEAWKEVTEMYMDLEEENSDQFTIVKYEDLVDNPLEETQELFDFLDLSYTDQTENFLRKSHERHDDDPYSVFRDKKVKKKWKWELDEEIKEEILNELEGTKFQRFI